MKQQHKPKPIKTKAKQATPKKGKVKVDEAKVIENRVTGLRSLVKNGVLTPQQILNHFRNGELDENITRWLRSK